MDVVSCTWSARKFLASSLAAPQTELLVAWVEVSTAVS